jgi:hypothetical protein
MTNPNNQPFNPISLMFMLKDELIQEAIRTIARAEIHLILDELERSKVITGTAVERSKKIEERNLALVSAVNKGMARVEAARQFSLSLPRVHQIMAMHPSSATSKITIPQTQPNLTPEQKAQNKKHYADWGIEDDDIDELIEKKLSGQIYLDIWNGNTPEATAKRYNITVAQAKNCYHHEDNLRNKKK